MKDDSYYEYDAGGDIAYCYPNSRVLRNKFGIKDEDELSKIERSISIVKAGYLTKRITGNFDLEHLRAIHKFLFEEIYEWAGELRTVDIAKGNMFCRSEFIELQFSNIYAELKTDDFLEDNHSIEFVSKRISYYLSEINAIHPFREGNGRAQRVFCQQLCLNTGVFFLDFSLVDGDEMIKASVESFYGKYESMDSLVLKCLRPL